MLLITIETDDIAINCIYTHKMIIDTLTKPILNDAFKAHMLSL